MSNDAVWPFPPPLTPAGLARRQVVPAGSGLRFEPKWDGYRAVLWAGATTRLDSRNGKSLAEAFPEVAAAGATLDEGTILDGELVVLIDGVCSFQAVQIRASYRRHSAGAASHTPATFVAFDILSHRGEDLRALPLSERRRILEATVSDRTDVVVTPSTVDRDVAIWWWDEYRERGCEGLVAKPDGSRYGTKPGWVKVRRTDTADLVVCGYRVTGAGSLHSLILGRPKDGGFAYVGEASVPPVQDRAELCRLLSQLATDRHPFVGPGPWIQNRWDEYRDTRWIPIVPSLVVEVAYDRFDGGILRHRARLVRVRPDKTPSSVR